MSNRSVVVTYREFASWIAQDAAARGDDDLDKPVEIRMVDVDTGELLVGRFSWATFKHGHVSEAAPDGALVIKGDSLVTGRDDDRDRSVDEMVARVTPGDLTYRLFASWIMQDVAARCDDDLDSPVEIWMVDVDSDELLVGRFSWADFKYGHVSEAAPDGALVIQGDSLGDGDDGDEDDDHDRSVDEVVARMTPEDRPDSVELARPAARCGGPC